MVRNACTVPVGKTFLSDEVFQSRVAKNFLGEVKASLEVDLHDLSTKHEAESLALVLGFPKDADELCDRYVFRVDRQSLEDLINTLSFFLNGDEISNHGEAACPFQEVVSTS